MDFFAYGKALSDMWALGGQAMIAAQDATAKVVASTIGHTTSPGELPGLAMFQSLAGDTADLARANQSVAELWSSAATLAQSLTHRLPNGERTDATADATFHKMIDPRSWLGATGEMDEMLSRLSEGPRLSDLWSVERKYTRVFQAWLGVRQRGLEHNAVLLGAWHRAAQAFSDQLGNAAKTGAPQDAKLMLRHWTETANKALVEAQRSDAFLATQAAMIKASTELRLAQHDLMEYYGERFGFPTRRELDDVHKTVTELKRELRHLRRAMAQEALAQPPAAATPPLASSRPRKTRS